MIWLNLHTRGQYPPTLSEMLRLKSPNRTKWFVIYFSACETLQFLSPIETNLYWSVALFIRGRCFLDKCSKNTFLSCSALNSFQRRFGALLLMRIHSMITISFRLIIFLLIVCFVLFAMRQPLDKVICTGRCSVPRIPTRHQSEKVWPQTSIHTQAPH